jgi:single-stranded-DNA-specific exonuclease
MPKILVAWSPDWHRGVVGIAAGRLAREFHRPVILLSVEEGSATGSGRSVPGLHLHHFLETWRDQLERFGGHAQAIGLTVAEDRLPELSAAWRQAAEAWEDEVLSRRFEYEAHLAPRDLSEDLLRRFETLEPFGEGNRQPLLRVGPLRLRGAPRKFSNNHLSAMVEGEDGFPARLLGWGWGDRAGRFEGRFEVLAYLERDHYRGGSTLRLLDSRSL